MADKRQRTKIVNNKKFTRFIVLKNSTNSKNSINSINALCCLLFALFCIPLSLEAKITGNCSNCHTMHNSQNGSAVVAEGPQSCLLNRADCLGCHGQSPSGTQNIIPFGNIPQVLHNHPTTDLAGGNFAYITGAKPRGTGTDSNTAGHNVGDLGAAYYEGTAAMFPPPGKEFSENNVITNSANFACAGTKGCHGNRNEPDKLLAIKGAHHTDDSVLKFGSINEDSQGGSIGSSYRFLKGVKGGEDIDWQATNSVTDHNEYKGATVGVEGGDAYTPGGNTISGLCSECHGNFHGGSADIGGPTGTPWLRHPTDIILPGDATKEYRLYNGGSGSDNPYSLLLPVARGTIPNSAGAVAKPGNSGSDGAIIMCLSCHRAHASPNFKMMRWDYKGWPASGGTNGCNICHTSKN